MHIYVNLSITKPFEIFNHILLLAYTSYFLYLTVAMCHHMSSRYGQQKETIIMTYKALIWCVLSYAARVWFPTISTESIKALKIIQNAAARIATGCHQRASINHLHAETQLLMVEQRLGLLCSLSI